MHIGPFFFRMGSGTCSSRADFHSTKVRERERKKKEGRGTYTGIFIIFIFVFFSRCFSSATVVGRCFSSLIFFLPLFFFFFAVPVLCCCPLIFPLLYSGQLQQSCALFFFSSLSVRVHAAAASKRRIDYQVRVPRHLHAVFFLCFLPPTSLLAFKQTSRQIVDALLPEAVFTALINLTLTKKESVAYGLITKKKKGRATVLLFFAFFQSAHTQTKRRSGGKTQQLT